MTQSAKNITATSVDRRVAEFHDAEDQFWRKVAADLAVPLIDKLRQALCNISAGKSFDG